MVREGDGSDVPPSLITLSFTVSHTTTYTSVAVPSPLLSETRQQHIFQE